jgi:hypothetical protein
MDSVGLPKKVVPFKPVSKGDVNLVECIFQITIISFFVILSVCVYICKELTRNLIENN